MERGGADNHHNGERPAKRPRLDHSERMFQPDGFAPSKSKASAGSRGGGKICSLPTFDFVSTFGIGREDKARKERRKTTSMTELGARLASAVASSSSNTLHIHKKQHIPAVSVRVHHPPVIPRPDFGLPVSSTLSKPIPKLSVLKPPVIDVNSIAGPSHSKDGRRTASLSALRPVWGPGPSTSTKSYSRISSVPNFTILPLKVPPKSKPLNQMLPPPPPLPKSALPPGTKLTAITRTRIARATDPSTEHGAQELLSLYLKQNGSGYMDPSEREMRRGLEQSPEKRTKKKEAKFLRGGLAEAASRRFAATRSNHSLWELEVDRIYRGGKRGMRSDIRVVIDTIIFASTPPSNPHAPHAPRVVLARCRVTHSNLPPHEAAFRPDKEIVVLFRVTSNTNAIPGINARKLEEGAEVCVWRSWFKIETPRVDVPGQFGFGSTIGGRTVWFLQRYYIPPVPVAIQQP